MKAMGLPLDAVKHAMQRDGKDPTIMDLDPDKSLKSQQENQSTGDDGPPLKDDLEYSKVQSESGLHSVNGPRDSARCFLN